MKSMKGKFFVGSGVIALTFAMVLAGCQQQAVPQKSPEDTVKDGISKLREVNSYEFEIAANADLAGPKQRLRQWLRVGLKNY